MVICHLSTTNFSSCSARRSADCGAAALLLQAAREVPDDVELLHAVVKVAEVHHPSRQSILSHTWPSASIPTACGYPASSTSWLRRRRSPQHLNRSRRKLRAVLDLPATSLSSTAGTEATVPISGDWSATPPAGGSRMPDDEAPFALHTNCDSRGHRRQGHRPAASTPSATFPPPSRPLPDAP